MIAQIPAKYNVPTFRAQGNAAKMGFFPNPPGSGFVRLQFGRGARYNMKKQMMMGAFHMEWNASLYDRQHGFVAAYGSSLLQFIPQNAEQSILDLGCGTGALTEQLSGMGRRVLGVDSSPEMIERARAQHPELEFALCDALNLPYEGEWDVVFSNAVFHWIGDHGALLRSIHRALKPGGLLICEFGAEGNIAAIERAFRKACAELDLAYRSRFNFSSPERFRSLLQANGFTIDHIAAFDRPTELKDGIYGLSNWMRQFFASELAVLPKAMRLGVLHAVEDETRDALWNGSAWVADYRRLRVVAHS